MIDENLPEGPGKLEFKPDEKRLAKLARFRRFVLLVTIVLLGGALLLTLTIQPRWMMVGVGVNPETVTTGRAPQSAETFGARTPSVPVISPAERQRSTIIATAQLIDSSARTAVVLWQRAEMLVMEGVLERDGAEEVLRRVTQARMVNDSARALLSEAKAGLERMKSMTNSVPVKGLRWSAFLTAGRDFLALLEDESKDRFAWLDAYESSVRAFASGDKADFEIKGNVAGGYLRKCEVRRRKLSRASVRLTESRIALESSM